MLVIKRILGELFHELQRVNIHGGKYVESEDFLQICFWQGSNLRPSACEVDVITTTLQKPAIYYYLSTFIWPVEYRYQI